MEELKKFFAGLWKSDNSDNYLKGMLAAMGIVYLVTAIVSCKWEGIYAYTTMPSYADDFIFRPWTILTYPWIHKNLIHLLGNCAVLFCFGKIFLKHLSQKRLIALFLTGTVAGGLLYLLTYEISSWIQHPLPYAHLAGASAGIMAVVCSLIPKAGKTRYPFFGKQIELNWIIIAFLAVSLIGTNLNSLGTLAAHVGGGLLGYCWIIVGRKWHVDLLYPAMWILEAVYSVKYFFYEQDGVYTPYEEVKDEKPEDDELDKILQKLRQSGYDALTDEEKKKLFEQKGRS